MKTVDIIAGVVVVIVLLVSGAALMAMPETPAPLLPEPEFEVTVDITEPEPPPPLPEPPPPLPEPPPPPEPPPAAALPPPLPAPAEPVEEAPGALPPLRANYRTHVGFQRYAEEMFRAGADFFITGARQDLLLQIDFANQRLVEMPVSRIVGRGYSPRTRVISDEPALEKYLELARTKYQAPSPEVIMLVPQTLENRLASRLQTALRAQGVRLQDVNGLTGSYRLQGNRLVLYVQEAHAAGRTCKLNLLVEIR